MRRAVSFIVTACVFVAASAAGMPTASARPTLDLCKLISRSAIEARIGSPLATPHDISTDPVSAECHFPAKAVGGTDVGLFASTNVPLGIKQSFQGSFFATPQDFASSYGTPTPVTGIGTAAYTAYSKQVLTTGALLVQAGPQHAVVIVLVGQFVTPQNTISRGRAIARLLLKTRQLRTPN